MEQIVESERVALVVWAAAVAAAAEGLVVVDRTAVLALAAVVLVDWPEVAVAVAGCFPAAALSEQSLAIAAVDHFPAAAVVELFPPVAVVGYCLAVAAVRHCPAVAAVDQFPPAAVVGCCFAVAAAGRAVLEQVAAPLIDLCPNRPN